MCSCDGGVHGIVVCDKRRNHLARSTSQPLLPASHTHTRTHTHTHTPQGRIQRTSPCSDTCSYSFFRKRSLETVSESPTMHTWRRARVTATLMRRWSARKPTWWVVFDLTMLMTTASRSWPWKPSTDRTATAGASDDSCSRSTATCALYGVMTAICSTNTGKAEATATERGAAMAHLIWSQPGLDQCHHMSANHTGLPDIGLAACTLVLEYQHRISHSTPNHGTATRSCNARCPHVLFSPPYRSQQCRSTASQA